MDLAMNKGRDIGGGGPVSTTCRTAAIDKFAVARPIHQKVADALF